MRNPFARVAYPVIPLEGAVVLVTGGARGIGRATAEAFVGAGAQVWIGDLDEGAAREAAMALGAGARALALDVTSRPSFAAFIDAAVSAHGRVDVLVNNAGIMPLGSFVDEADAISRLTLEVNVWGPVLGMRLALPGMIERGRGHIVNVASMAGKIAVPGMAVYNASKFAAVGLSQAVRHEVAAAGVSVSAVLPSAVRTELVAGIPLGHGMPTVEPSAIADAIVETCASRRALRLVPRYLAAWDVVEALTPERVLAAVRSAFGENRAMTSLDRNARRGYDERVARQAGRRPA